MKLGLLPRWLCYCHCRRVVVSGFGVDKQVTLGQRAAYATLRTVSARSSTPRAPYSCTFGLAHSSPSLDWLLRLTSTPRHHPHGYGTLMTLTNGITGTDTSALTLKLTLILTTLTRTLTLTLILMTLTCSHTHTHTHTHCYSNPHAHTHIHTHAQLTSKIGNRHPHPHSHWHPQRCPHSHKHPHKPRHKYARTPSLRSHAACTVRPHMSSKHTQLHNTPTSASEVEPGMVLLTECLLAGC
jgi:hypothetical protein